jgi:hypothetical protein
MNIQPWENIPTNTIHPILKWMHQCQTIIQNVIPNQKERDEFYEAIHTAATESGYSDSDKPLFLGYIIQKLSNQHSRLLQEILKRKLKEPNGNQFGKQPIT